MVCQSCASVSVTAGLRAVKKLCHSQDADIYKVSRLCVCGCAAADGIVV